MLCVCECCCPLPPTMFSVAKVDGALRFVDRGGYQSRNALTMWCIEEADRVYGFGDFEARSRGASGKNQAGGARCAVCVGRVGYICASFFRSR